MDGTSAKTDLGTCNDPQTNPSPEEQVFSDNSLMDRIWKHFNTQDLIRTSAVSQNWHTRSRESLKSQYFKHPICIQISQQNPCRELLEFNAFLQEKNETYKDKAILFNGIHHQSREKLACSNCLATDVENEEDEFQMMQKYFGNILDNVQFKYLRLGTALPLMCPFSKLIKFILKEKSEEIRELDVASGAYFNLNIVKEYLINSDYPIRDDEYMLFPNLEVLGINNEQFSLGQAGIPIAAPSLKTLKHFSYNSYRHSGALFPRHAITILEIATGAMAAKSACEELEEFKPNIGSLSFERGPNPSLEEDHCSEDHRKDLCKLGRLISLNLKFLTCSPYFLMHIAGGNHGNKNKFPQLTTLNLSGWQSLDVMDWFGDVDFSEMFPKLENVRLIYAQVCPKNKNAVRGPFNQVQKCVFKGVKNLILGQSMPSTLTMGFSPLVIKMFSNIRHLDLSKMFLNYDCYDRKFGEIMNELENLKFLEELTIRPPALNSFALDHLFLEYISEITNFMMIGKMKQFLIYKTSILDHKNLRRINIHGEKICTKRKSDSFGYDLCYSDQLPGIFLVSTRTAKIICARRPGFTFRVIIESMCTPECKSGFRPGGIRLEHLEPFTRITTPEDSRAGFSNTLDIEFKKIE